MVHCRSRLVRGGPASAGLMAEPRACGSPLPLSPTNRNNGGPERIRTFDLCLRRAALYPAELRVPDRQNSNNPPLLQGLSFDDAPPVRNSSQPCHEKDTLGL